MYNRIKISKLLEDAEECIYDWYQELEKSDKDLLKFYKKGQKLAGTRLRRRLKYLIDEIQILRLDIKRLGKEREIFKGTEFEKDFKRIKRSDASPK